MGIFWGVKLRFNAVPVMHENPQRLVYTYHINESAIIVFYPSPFLLDAEQFVLITLTYFTCGVISV